MGRSGDRETRIVTRWRNRNLTQALHSTLDRAFPPGEEAGFGEALEALEAIDQADGNIPSDRNPADKRRG